MVIYDPFTSSIYRASRETPRFQPALPACSSQERGTYGSQKNAGSVRTGAGAGEQAHSLHGICADRSAHRRHRGFRLKAVYAHLHPSGGRHPVSDFRRTKAAARLS